MCILIVLMPPPPDERPDDLVGPDYLARRFGRTEDTARRRRGVFARLARVTEKPPRWRRGDVDDLLRELNERRFENTPEAKAARLLRRGRKNSARKG